MKVKLRNMDSTAEVKRYSGACSHCKRQLLAVLELEPYLTPPALFGVFCHCKTPPTAVVLTLRTS